MYNEALVLIEDLCVLITNLPLNHYGMPSPDRPDTDLVNTDLQREKQYDHGNLATIIVSNEPLLTAEQKNIYDRIMLAVSAEQGCADIYFGLTKKDVRKLAYELTIKFNLSRPVSWDDREMPGEEWFCL
ncbi:unnamed protein product [Pieris macdunnoughi]|uniref:Uncharacterized protein n=1 Tax=Pieris macdunnoughi TaxID=345717 RepID=A0A821UGA1_9NEOP|nr:unnamed protein product [Pieris macdunnoughi]